MSLAACFANGPADRRTIELWHHPVQQSQPRTFRLAHLLGCPPAVPHRRHFVSGAFKSLLQQPERDRIVVGNQNLHSCAPVPSAVSAAINRSVSPSISGSSCWIFFVSRARAADSTSEASEARCAADKLASIPRSLWATLAASSKSPPAIARCSASRCAGRSSR